MLVLTRRTGESIVIGNNIVVTVLEVRHDQVRIGIDAPRTVQVHREEVFNQVLRENTAAVASAADRANPLLRKPLPRPAAAQPVRKGPRLEPKRVAPRPPDAAEPTAGPPGAPPPPSAGPDDAPSPS
ncbi:MAG TPA: carbon storage regulator CsrA [Egibacteraceae bacterium]|nr:carbon storage regulator CsrA [Egibacteraceae bacterium]